MCRGVIYNRERASQIIDFSGLAYGNRKRITPTDIDGAIDFGGDGFLFMEFKLAGNVMPRGQSLYWKHLLPAIAKPSALVVCEHTTPIGQDVDAANSSAVSIWTCGEGSDEVVETNITGGCTVKNAIEEWLRSVGLWYYFTSRMEP